MPGIITSAVLLTCLPTERALNMGTCLITVVKLSIYKDGDVGNLRKFEYLIQILDIRWREEIKFN